MDRIKKIIKHDVEPGCNVIFVLSDRLINEILSEGQQSVKNILLNKMIVGKVTDVQGKMVTIVLNESSQWKNIFVSLIENLESRYENGKLLFYVKDINKILDN